MIAYLALLGVIRVGLTSAVATDLETSTFVIVVQRAWCRGCCSTALILTV